MDKESWHSSPLHQMQRWGKGFITCKKSRDKGQRDVTILAHSKMYMNKVHFVHNSMAKKDMAYRTSQCHLAGLGFQAQHLAFIAWVRNSKYLLSYLHPFLSVTRQHQTSEQMCVASQPFTNLLCFAARRNSTDNQYFICPIQELCKSQICLSFFCAKDLAAQSRRNVRFC